MTMPTIPSPPKPSSVPRSPSTPTTARPTTMSLTTPWARRFILSHPKDALLPIPREFLSDGFNLVQLAPIVERAVEGMGLRRNEADVASEVDSGNGDNIEISKASQQSLYKVALRLILNEGEEKTNANANGLLSSSSSTTKTSKYTPLQIQKAAEVLYTLVHARYVASPRGLDTIRRMFKRNTANNSNNDMIGRGAGDVEPIFGRCCRMKCNGMPLLPFGISDQYDIGGKGGAGRRAMRYCPSCGETFYLWDSKIDGSAWGSSFAHLFLMAHGSETFRTRTRMGIQRGDSSAGVFGSSMSTGLDEKMRPIPKIFGFRIHRNAEMFM